MSVSGPLRDRAGARSTTLGFVLSLRLARPLPPELEAVVRQAAGYAEQLTKELAGRPDFQGLDLYVGWGRPPRPWRATTVAMTAFLLRYPAPQKPLVLEHVEPIMSRRGLRQPWRLHQTAEAARDNMATALHQWQEPAP